jgi:type II secretory pathway predicted ATPase ExeA
MYLPFYGLNEQPFGFTPDPHFLYMGAAHQEAFQSLISGIETGCGFMALIAAPGMGKTTTLMRLMEKLSDSAMTAFLFQIHSSPKEFLKNLLRDLNVEPSGKDLSDLQGQLQSVIMRGSQSGKRLVLVIDEAQSLDDSLLEMIRTLSNFESPRAKLIQIVLAGHPNLASKLVRSHLAQLRQRLSVIAQLTPFDGNEVREYIEHRLRVAGYHGESLFTPEALTLIAEYSRGTPRAINNICFNALSLGCANGHKQIDAPIVREALTRLNLESFGERNESKHPVVQEPASALREVKSPAECAVNNTENELRWQPEPLGADLDSGTNHFKTDHAILEEVDISGNTRPHGGQSANGRSSPTRGGSSAGRKSLGRPRAFALLAIGAVAICMWGFPYLMPKLNVVERIRATAQDKLQNVGDRSAEDRREGVLPPRSAQVLEATPGSPQKSNVELPRTDASGAHGILTNASGGGSNDEKSGILASAPALGDLHDEATKKLESLAPENSGQSGRGVVIPGRDDLGARGVQGNLIVQSSVSGARISIDGRSQSRWVTPHLFSLAAGTYAVSVSKAGYVPWTRRLKVDEGQKNWTMADLKSFDQGGGIFTVDTEPAGMQVFIDGKSYGASRVETVLSAGWHECSVVPGHRLQTLTHRFHLDPGETLTRRIRLRSASPSSTAAAKPQPNSADALGLSLPSQGERLE